MHIEFAPRQKRRVSLTPLIDVVFNLLLFFMLASSLARWNGVELATGSEAAVADDIPAANVYLSGADQYRYEDVDYRLAELTEQLKTELNEKQISSVILRAEEGVLLHELIEGFDMLGHAGITALALGDVGEL